MSDPRAANRLRAERAFLIDAAESDLEIIKPALDRLDVEIAALVAQAPHLNLRRVRDALALLEAGWSDLRNDTVAAAVKFAEEAIEDASPLAGVYA